MSEYTDKFAAELLKVVMKGLCEEIDRLKKENEELKKSSGKTLDFEKVRAEAYKDASERFTEWFHGRVTYNPDTDKYYLVLNIDDIDDLLSYIKEIVEGTSNESL